MRKQYHFRPSKDGLMAWDIHRLVNLSKDFTVIDVPLEHIKELNEAYWFEADDTQPTCRNVAAHSKLIREVDLRFPIILFSNGRVADGMHRVCRALIDGYTTIKAVQFSIDPTPDYVGIEPEDLPYD